MPPTIARPGIPDGETLAFLKHICPPKFSDGDLPVQNGLTLDAVPGEELQPNFKFIERHLLRNFNLVTMEGDNLSMWVIEDPSRRPLTIPSCSCLSMAFPRIILAPLLQMISWRSRR